MHKHEWVMYMQLWAIIQSSFWYNCEFACPFLNACVCVGLKFNCPLLYFLHFRASSAYSTNQKEESHISLNEPIKLALQNERPQGTNALILVCSSSPLTAISTISSSHLWLSCHLSSLLSSCLSPFFILLFPGLSLSHLLEQRFLLFLL